MPNNLKGSEARTEVVSVRFTAKERKQLEEKYGKAARGIHAIVAAALREEDR